MRLTKSFTRAPASPAIRMIRAAPAAPVLPAPLNRTMVHLEMELRDRCLFSKYLAQTAIKRYTCLWYD